MKVNRRKLFGVGAGAAVAGPSVLSEVATVAATMAAGMGATMPPTPAPYYGETMLAKTNAASDPKGDVLVDVPSAAGYSDQTGGAA